MWARATEKLRGLVGAEAARCSHCPEPSSSHWSSPSADCGERGGIFQAALLGEASPRMLILFHLLLLSCLTPLLHPPLHPTAKFDVAFLWRAEREGEVPIGEQPPGCRQQGRGECWWLVSVVAGAQAGLVLGQPTLLFTRSPGQKLGGRN